MDAGRDGGPAGAHGAEELGRDRLSGWGWEFDFIGPLRQEWDVVNSNRSGRD